MRWFAALILLVPAIASGQIIGLNTHSITLTSLGKNVTPTAINNVGLVVGQGANGVAFKWQSGVTTNLGTLGGATSYANDVNDNGIIVGWSLDAGGLQKAFKYDGALNNIDSVSSLQSSAEAINLVGEIVGWKQSLISGNFRSAIWTVGNPLGVLLFGNVNSRAYGFNDAGRVVGIILQSNNEPQNGYYWDGADASTITSLMGSSYLPYAGINAHGYTAGNHGSVAALFEIIVDSSSTNIPVLNPADSDSFAYGINDNELIVGESGVKAFIYNATSGDLFNMNSFTNNGDHFDSLLRLTDINNNGQFVGVATLNGESYGFVGSFTAIPEPGTWAILLGGALLFFRRKK